MKIQILGQGISAHLALIKFYRNNEINWERKNDNFTLPMSSTLDLIPFIQDTFNINYSDLPKFNSIVKTGVRKTNFNNNDFYSNFSMPYNALHFDSKSFNNYIYENIDFTETNKTDFVIDATKPKDLTDYKIIEHIPVNSAVGIKIKNKTKRNYTHILAVNYGWLQIIPTLEYVYIYYIYNNKINKTEQIENELSMFNSKEYHHINFDSYYMQNPFKDNYLHLGLNSFFIEPFDATSLSGNLRLLDLADDLINKTIKKDYALFLYQDYIKESIEILMLHYVSKVKYKTEFWKNANEQATDYLLNKGHKLRNPSNFYSESGFKKLYSNLGLFNYIQ